MSLNSKIRNSNIIDLNENNNNLFKDYIPEKSILKNDINQYQIKEIIGEGMFGKVKLAIHLITKEKVAIKIFDKGKIKSQKEKQYIEREISILKKLNHYNTIKLYNIIQNDEYIFLIQEYISDKELLHFIENNDNLSEKDICKLYQQIISGIEYLHEMGIAHRDLKLENILLNYKKDIKIIDFGLSNNYDRDMDELLHSSCGSPCYAAPEMIRGMEYRGLNTDIWSSGIILYLMLCKCFPFNDKNNSKLYQKILSGKFNIPNNLSNEAKDIIINLLKVNPQERIKLNEIKNHPWFNLINKNKNYYKGIDNSKIIMPIDEDIIKEMTKFGIDKSIIINNILKNDFNNITTTYNLLLQKKIRNGKKSVADYCSDLYLQYINDEKNKFSYFNNDIDLIIKSRIRNITNNENNIKIIPNLNIEHGFSQTLRYNNNNPYNYNNNYLIGKTNIKIFSKSDEYTNRQITERPNEKKLLLNFPFQFHTIDHDSYSNSKKKKILNKKMKNKISNTQFNTKRNNNKNQYNINTIKNNGYCKNKYKELLPTHYIKSKKSNDLYLRLLNKRSSNRSNNKYNIFQNYRQYAFNKSVENKYTNTIEKSNDMNNYNNIKNNKFNDLRQIRKKIREPVELIKNQKTIDQSSETPIKTENEQIYNYKEKKETSFNNVYKNFNMGSREKDKTKIQLNNRKYSNDKNYKTKTNFNNNNYYKINNNNLNKQLIIGLSINNTNNNNNHIREANIYGIDPLQTKRNSLFYEEKINGREINHKILLSLSQQKDKDKKKIKTKTLSVDLKNHGRNEINVYTNKPKRKNVMKFINKINNNNDININMNMNFNNIYNKYSYFYKNEIRKNIHNKSLDMNNNKKLNIY